MKFLIFILLIIASYTCIHAQQKDPLSKYYANSQRGADVQPTGTLSTAMTEYVDFDVYISQKLDFSVPIISVKSLKELQTKKELVFLDTRSELAYDISHIATAQRVGFDDFSIENVWTIPRDANIIVYCTVGAKSEKVGKYLIDMGFTNVQNLYGSIIEWVNEGGEVIDKNENPTRKILIKDNEKKNFLKKGKAIIVTSFELQKK